MLDHCPISLHIVINGAKCKEMRKTSSMCRGCRRGERKIKEDAKK